MGTESKFLGEKAMIQITPQMRIFVAVEATDFRKGIDSLCQVCRSVLKTAAKNTKIREQIRID